MRRNSDDSYLILSEMIKSVTIWQLKWLNILCDAIGHLNEYDRIYDYYGVMNFYIMMGWGS